MEAELKCLRCDAPMVEGQVLGPPYFRPSVWVDGIPERGWLGPKLKPSELMKVGAFRCLKCGYVELNAKR